MIIGQDVRRIRFVCFGGGESEGVGDQSVGSLTDQEKETFGRQAAGNRAAKEGIGYAGVIGGGGMKGTSGADAAAGAAGVVGSEISNAEEKASTYAQTKSVLSKLSNLHTVFSVVDALTPEEMSARTAFGLNASPTGAGFVGEMGHSNEMQPVAKPVSARQGIAVNTAPVSQKELQTKQNEAQANPEEAAAMAEQEEKKKARQRVGLLQMRAVDPLFIEGLPDIFRSRAV